MVCFLCLTYFTFISRPSVLLQMALFHSFFMAGYMYHIFFIHSSVDGYLGSFHVLATVNSAAMNTACIYLNWSFCLFWIHV